jgi:hypothetical protein
LSEKREWIENEALIAKVMRRASGSDIHTVKGVVCAYRVWIACAKRGVAGAPAMVREHESAMHAYSKVGRWPRGFNYAGSRRDKEQG